jgi:hypothetical protein
MNNIKKPFRQLTVFWRTLLSLSSEEKKTVATFSTGMLINVYQIVWCHSQEGCKCSWSEGWFPLLCWVNDMSCANGKLQIVPLCVVLMQLHPCFSHPCVPAHWECGNGVVPAVDTKRWRSEACVGARCNVPSGLWHGSGEMKLCVRNCGEVWETRSTYWPVGSTESFHFYHSSGEMKLWGRNCREVWETRSTCWPVGSTRVLPLLSDMGSKYRVLFNLSAKYRLVFLNILNF